MRYSATLALGLMACHAAALPAANGPLLDESSVDILELGPAQHVELAPTAHDPEVRDTEGTLTTSLDVRGLEKRVFIKELMLDTGTHYRATYNGLRIIVWMFFDLAANRALFHWTKDGDYHAPDVVEVGFRDLTTGRVLDIVGYAAGSVAVLSKFRAGDMVQVFQAKKPLVDGPLVISN